MPTSFDAPWATSVKVMTAIVAGIAVFVVLGTNAVVAALLAAVILGTALFAVRGYTVQGRELLIHRLVGVKRVDLASLRSAEHRPGAMGGSWRLFGVGGLFGYTGLFRNKTLGRYHAYGTDPARSVVLEVGDRTIVVTPGDPVGFVQAVSAR